MNAINIVPAGSLIKLMFKIYDFNAGQYLIVMEDLQISGNDGVSAVEIHPNSFIPTFSIRWFGSTRKQYMLSNDFKVIQNGT